MPLYLEIETGETVSLGGGEVTITLVAKTGRKARLEISAPRSIKVEKVSTTKKIASNGLSPWMSNQAQEGHSPHPHKEGKQNGQNNHRTG